MTQHRSRNKNLGLTELIAIALGGMVGGGIFAVLGLSVALAQGGVPVSFLVAGTIAFLTAFSYAKLSVAYPDKGGTVRFINEGYGTGVFRGGLNNMLWVSYIIMLALYASAFGSYAASLIAITGNVAIDQKICITFIILISTFINYYSFQEVQYRWRNFRVRELKLDTCFTIFVFTLLASFIVLNLYHDFMETETKNKSRASKVTQRQ